MSDENNTPDVTSRSGTAFELEASRAALAIALIRFLDLTGGADGMSTGRGDPRVVRGMALNALDRAGFAYATTSKELDPLPSLNDTSAYVSRDDRMDNGGRRFKPVAHVSTAPRRI